ncbi:S1 family peptidase [Catellatospora tritici]|uniref:S1 family peptidase n=1 Tax=Catellatospora tritici TaxID=2851566 RepID=UPI001C2DB0BF|nr:serine protease [Catellatospora tritici]MBV1850677.1 putative Ig domain-containing protein [Catellatospora tritici]MBV1850930.1 putative Ig domain-containing protein [Catellatospora tritici]
MFRRIATTVGALVLGAAAIAVPAVPATAVTLQAASLNATIALNNCSASLVRFPSSVSTDRAMMLTNGHCYEGGMPGAGDVLQNRSSTRSGTLLNASGTGLGTVRADQLIYATMTDTDVALYRLNTTFASIQSSYGVTALTISATRPASGSSMFIPSSYWKQIWNCTISAFVPTLREGVWTWHDSIKYNSGCQTTHGTSGSPIVDLATNNVVGINNTGNDDGQSCTLNNPCEVDANGTTHVYQGQSYGQQTYWFTTCLNASRAIDLTVSGCLLPKPPGTGNTVTVTNPGNQSSVVGTAVNLQITASSSGSGQTLTYSATGLPAGLTINASTGKITGTPTTAQTTTVTVTAKDTTNATGTASFSWTVSSSGGTCSGQLFGNPGFETGTSPWTQSSGVIDNSSGQAAHGGSYKAWLNGYGSTHTDTLSQSVTIPAGCRATLTYWLHIDTAETTTTVAYDKLTVAAGSTTIASYSNLNKNTGYALRTIDVSAYAGQTVVIKFTGVEDASLQTSFVIDDTALTLS